MFVPSLWQACLATVFAGLAIPFTIYPEHTLRTLRKKRYQYEVTFGLYMLTPTEKFILNSFLFLTISMITLATVIYLPSHMRFVASRMFYYISGRFTYPSYSFSSVSEGVTSVNNALQHSLSSTTPDQIYQASQRIATRASDITKGLMAAAAGHVGTGAGNAATDATANGAMYDSSNAPEQPLEAHLNS